MIVQAIALLDDLDKEINIYAMRVKVRARELIQPSTLQQLTCVFSGMVRLAFPRDGKDHLRQSSVR